LSKTVIKLFKGTYFKSQVELTTIKPHYLAITAVKFIIRPEIPTLFRPQDLYSEVEESELILQTYQITKVLLFYFTEKYRKIKRSEIGSNAGFILYYYGPYR